MRQENEYSWRYKLLLGENVDEKMHREDGCDERNV
jgi:hypothetical protein